MKRFIFWLLALTLAASCGEKVKKGDGDAAIGFAQTEYEVPENAITGNSAGYFRIPIQITGSPAVYPLSFDLQATALQGIEELDKLVSFTQMDDLKYYGNGIVYAEFHINDNDVVDRGERSFSLNIVNVDGAKVENPAAVVKIIDNEFDADPKLAYDKLQGEWLFSAVGIISQSRYNFDVNISDGFTPEEKAANRYKRLVCWGLADTQLIFSGTPISHQPVWYIDMGSLNNVQIAVGTLMSDKIDIDLGEGVSFSTLKTVAVSVRPASTAGKLGMTAGSEIKGTWSEDYNTITFEPDAAFGGVIVLDDVISDYFMQDAYYNITMTRK